MNAVEPAAEAKPTSQATLGELLEGTAYAQLPSRFYGMLQLCLPLAVQCWMWGLPRTAGWLAVISAFGLWALARQRTHGHADAIDESSALTSARSHRGWRFLRSVAATGGSIGALVLILEGFARILAQVFGCPGCAG